MPPRQPAHLSLFCGLSFLIYASAVLIQAQYHGSFWGSDNGVQIPGAVSYAVHGTPLGTIDGHEIAKDGIGVSYLIFTSLSMKAFGADIDAVPLGLLVLLGLSALAFVARFDGSRLLALPFLFLVLTLILITPVTTDPYTRDGLPIGGSRYMGVIAILPSIHILFELLEPSRKPWHLLLLLVQAAFLAFAVFVRGATGYFLIAIAVLSLVLWWRNRARMKLLITWAALVASAAAVLTIIIVSVPSEYVSSGRLFGVFWHRIFISISVHPGWPYGNLRTMFDCTNAYPDGLNAGFDKVGWCAWYAAHPDDHPTEHQQLIDQQHNFYDTRYERVMRDAFFKVAKAYPQTIFETFLLDKSELIYSTLLEAVGARTPSNPPVVGPGRAKASDVPKLTKRAIPFVVLQFLIFTICFVLAGDAREMIRLAAVFASFFVLSLLPLYAVYSFLYVSLDMVIYTFAVLTAIAVLIVFTCARYYSIFARDFMSIKKRISA
jgi:hypothetical protein